MILRCFRLSWSRPHTVNDLTTDGALRRTPTEALEKQTQTAASFLTRKTQVLLLRVSGKLADQACGAIIRITKKVNSPMFYSQASHMKALRNC